jgi:superfamily II DNA/RNA helicase
MTQFSDLALDPRVLQAVTDTGYTIPTPIQVQAIPHALEGRDVLGIAQTGTGKTAGFVLPMITLLQKGRARARMPRTLVLCPTRELAAQVAENFETYAKHVKLTMALLIGGVSFKDQDKLIDRGVDVLIATPGRLLDHHERGKLMLTGVQIMVVDEADRMLDMGFIPDIERIFKLTPFTRQTLFFSATMPPEITRLTQEFLHNPVRVEVARQATTAENIAQVICRHTPSRRDRTDAEKREVLRRLITAEGEALTNAIVFCNRKRDVDVVAKSLKRHGFDAAALHGDLDQSLRTKILTSFRDKELRLLVASDVAARGLDIPSVSHVFNFDVPIHAEDYVHRIGRTGRAGRSGKAITIFTPSDGKYLDRIEELVKMSIPTAESPLAAGTAFAEEATTDRSSGPRADERPARSRRRSRGDAPATPPAEEAVAAPAPARAPQAPARAPSRDAEPEAPLPRRSASAGEAGRRSGPRTDARRGGPRSGPREAAVSGLGDHVPAFLMRDFRHAVEATARDDDESTDPADEATAAAPGPQRAPDDAPAGEPTAAAAPKRPARRRTPASRSPRKAEAAPAA